MLLTSTEFRLARGLLGVRQPGYSHACSLASYYANERGGVGSLFYKSLAASSSHSRSFPLSSGESASLTILWYPFNH